MLNWLTRIYNKGSLKIPDINTIEFIEDFKIKLSYYLYETYANIIIEQFFNIIIGILKDKYTFNCHIM